ncbi:MAG TPA: SLBB domain-containing protein [Candidatus Binataceae bacterium]|nr:SLBB domain-containing protein [Candidatus Binataceae bacterium]
MNSSLTPNSVIGRSAGLKTAAIVRGIVQVTAAVLAMLVLAGTAVRAQSDNSGDQPNYQQSANGPGAMATPGVAVDGQTMPAMGDGQINSGQLGVGNSGGAELGGSGADHRLGQAGQPGPGFGGGVTNGISGGPSLSTVGAGVSAGASGVAQAAFKLGMSPAEMAGLRNQMANGSLTPDELQQLCLRFASRQLTPRDVAGIADSLGLALTGQQLAQLKSCTQLAAPDSTMPPPADQIGASAPGATGPGTPPASPPSSIERSFQALDSGLTPTVPSAQNLTQFGYAVFDARVSTFAPVGDVPVGPDYEVGPGDELKVLIWGRVNDKLDLVVQRDGSVLMPQIGPLQVAGLSFAQAQRLIEERSEQITGVRADVTMGRLRTIQVSVIGEVKQPGTYTVSALSRVSNALSASGGITRVGSLRKVELRRGNQLIRVIDLYDLLQSGSTQADQRLEADDVVFVPVIGPVTAVAGDVKRPAIYELARDGESLPGVLRLAGGISAFGYAQRVQVERVQNHERRIALDIDMNQARAQRFTINDGDLIKVYPVLPQQKDIVTVKGNVNRPGSYQWYSGIKVTDLVREAEGTAPQTFFRYALIRRLSGADKMVRLVPVDLGDALSDTGGGAGDAELQAQDTLTVFNQDQIKDLPTVQVFGEVRNPGYYVLDRGMHVSDLIYLAGGLKDDAYLTRAELARTQVVNGQRTSHTYEDLDLHQALSGSDSSNPALAANDQLFVRRASDWHLPWVVEVRGQVLRPGPYTIHEGERLASLLERCGGLMPDAYPAGTIFVRQSIKQIEQKRLDEARQQMQQEIARYELQPAGLDQDANQSQSSKVDPSSMIMLQKVLDQSQSQQAQGRLVIHLRPLDQLGRSEDDIVLEDQDQILVPRRPASVNVLGSVYSPNAIVYQPSLTVRDYLERAGGPDEGGDTEHIFVVQADGSIMTDAGLKNGSEASMFPLLPAISGGLMGQHLQPGDTVFVPVKLYYPNKTRLYSNMAQIFASAAQGVAIVALAAGL